MGQPIPPMLARLVRELPQDGYLFEPKWDGFRCLASRDGEQVELHSRHGRSLTRYFPELVKPMAELEPACWTIDGEVLVTVDGRLDFESLMARLHPAASRVRELALRTPAMFVAFDLPLLGTTNLMETTFAMRRRRLVALMEGISPPLFVTPATAERRLAERWLD